MARDVVLRAQQRQASTSDNFAWQEGKWPTKYINLVKLPFDSQTVMNGVAQNFDAGRSDNCSILWENAGSTMVLELLPSALAFYG